jgi:large subunit ribosomal protein L24e
MPACTFCGKTFEFKGKMLVMKSGKVLYFCTSKCEKNTELGRKGRETRWTKTAHELKTNKK